MSQSIFQYREGYYEGLPEISPESEAPNPIHETEPPLDSLMLEYTVYMLIFEGGRLKQATAQRREALRGF